MEFLLYIGIFLITLTSLWVIIAYPKNYMFKAVFIPVLIGVAMATFFTYQAILGYGTSQAPPEVVRYLYHASDRESGTIYTLLVGDIGEPRLYKMPWNEELEKQLESAGEAAREGVAVFGRFSMETGSEFNQGKWVWYDMPPSEFMPKSGDDSAMRTCEKGINLIKEFEGRRLVAYQDSVGVWTIGYGHTKTAHEDKLIIKSTADKLLAEDLAEFEKYVDSLVTVDLNQNQFDALIAWTFNLGPGNLIESTMLKVLNEGKYDEVPYQMKRWNKAGGEVLEGLVRRREAEAALFGA